MSFYVDKQEIESEESVASAAAATADNNEDDGDASDFKKKLRFIEED